MRRRLAPPLALLALCASLGAAACGDEEEDDASTGGGEPTQAQTETAAPDLTDTGTKPVIEKASGAPPRRLATEDIVKGSGKVARKGSQVTVHYVGVSFSNGEQFDASWDSGAPFGPFPLGAGEVIPGWDRGLVGMREGGRRKLTIPPELAYGAQGFPPDIAPNETLIFVVDLVEVG